MRKLAASVGMPVSALTTAPERIMESCQSFAWVSLPKVYTHFHQAAAEQIREQKSRWQSRGS